MADAPPEGSVKPKVADVDEASVGGVLVKVAVPAGAAVSTVQVTDVAALRLPA
jgi:hypothetical protein